MDLSAYRYDRIERFLEDFGAVAVEEGVLPGQAIDGDGRGGTPFSREKKSLRLLLSGQDEVKLDR